MFFLLFLPKSPKMSTCSNASFFFFFPFSPLQLHASSEMTGLSLICCHILSQPWSSKLPCTPSHHMSYHLPHSLPSKRRLLMFTMDPVILWAPGRDGNAVSDQVGPFLESLLNLAPRIQPHAGRQGTHVQVEAPVRKAKPIILIVIDTALQFQQSALDALWCLKTVHKGRKKATLVSPHWASFLQRLENKGHYSRVK